MTSEQNSVWKDDKLGRQAQSKDIVSYLISRSEGRREAGLARGFVLAIDSDYGQGKSYFVQNTMADIIINHPACLIDAWTDDRIDSPFLTILDGIERALEPFFSNDENLKDKATKLISDSRGLVKGFVFGAGKQVAIKIVGESAALLVSEALEDDIDGGDIADATEEALSEGVKRVEGLEDSSSKRGLKEYRQQKLSMRRLRNRLQLLSEHIAGGQKKSLPIFVFIDELDRCRPDYAISLLEEVKHLFDVPGFVFVLSMQKTQLLHSISAVYGDRFDAASYLDRFVDKFYTLDAPSCENFVKLELAKEPLNADNFLAEPMGLELGSRIALVFDQVGLTLREAERAIDTLRASATLLGKTKVDAMYLAARIAKQMNIEKRQPRQPFQAIHLEWQHRENAYQTVAKRGRIDSFSSLINQITQCAGWDLGTVQQQIYGRHQPETYYGYALISAFYEQFDIEQRKNVTMAALCDDLIFRAKPFQMDS